MGIKPELSEALIRAARHQPATTITALATAAPVHAPSSAARKLGHLAGAILVRRLQERLGLAAGHTFSAMRPRPLVTLCQYV